MRENSERLWYQMEETINNLQKDPRVAEPRAALVKFVDGFLLDRIQKRLEEMGITEACLEQFRLETPANKRGPARKVLYQLLEENSQALRLSRENIRLVRRTARLNRQAGLETLKTILLKEERIAFRKEAEIDPSVWQNFIHGSNYTGQETLAKLAKGLNLDASQEKVMRSKAIRSSVPVDEDVRKEVKKRSLATGMNLTQFKAYACIGKDAWEVFYVSTKEPERKKRASQETLLKLVVGYGEDEKESWAFMDAVGSGFYVRRDVVVLACILQNRRTPDAVYPVLEKYGADGATTEYFENLYRWEEISLRVR